MRWIGQIKQTACFDFRVSVRLHLWLLCGVILSQTSGLNSMCVCLCLSARIAVYLPVSGLSCSRDHITEMLYHWPGRE